MATHPELLQQRHAPRLRALHDARARRWCWIALALAVGLALYIGALAWAARELEAGVERSIQPLPALMRDNPATD